MGWVDFVPTLSRHKPATVRVGGHNRGSSVARRAIVRTQPYSARFYVTTGYIAPWVHRCPREHGSLWRSIAHCGFPGSVPLCARSVSSDGQRLDFVGSTALRPATWLCPPCRRDVRFLDFYLFCACCVLPLRFSLAPLIIVHHLRCHHARCSTSSASRPCFAINHDDGRFYRGDDLFSCFLAQVEVGVYQVAAWTSEVPLVVASLPMDVHSEGSSP